MQIRAGAPQKGIHLVAARQIEPLLYLTAGDHILSVRIGHHRFQHAAWEVAPLLYKLLRDVVGDGDRDLHESEPTSLSCGDAPGRCVEGTGRAEGLLHRVDDQLPVVDGDPEELAEGKPSLAHLQQFPRAPRKKFPVRSGNFQVQMPLSDPILVPNFSPMLVDFKALIG